jgi:Ca2+-binding RTX toxin-like protein
VRLHAAVAAALAITAALATVAVAYPGEFRGTARDDLLRGHPGRDRLQGFGGDDILEGGGGPDALFGGPGLDTASGGPSNDLLKLASDRVPDVLICGRGFDVVSVDRFDSVRPRDQGQDRICTFLAAFGAPAVQRRLRHPVPGEASGVYTPVGEATVTRACA